jgi:hypothetical protein
MIHLQGKYAVALWILFPPAPMIYAVLPRECGSEMVALKPIYYSMKIMLKWDF